MANVKRDDNFVTALSGISSVDGETIVPLRANPANGRLLIETTSGDLGDVIGPASSTDNAIARFDGTTGKIIQNSGATIDDSGNITGSNLSGTNTGDQDISGISTNASAITDIETKTDFISVTQAVDLDQMETDIAALANGMVYKGAWDASAGTFPSSADTGFFYTVSVAGTVDSIEFAVDDRLIAITDSASTTVYAGNWTKLDATDAVQSVVGLTGNISKSGLTNALDLESMSLQAANAVNIDGGAIDGTPIGATTPSTGEFSTVETSGNIELGHATDTTLSRSSAGVLAVEGVVIPSVSSTSTLTNKTLTTPAIASVKGTLTTDTDGATITFDKNVSDFHNVVMAGNRTLALSNMAVGDRIVLRLTQDATGTRVPTFFTTIKWAGGTAPTLTTTANKADIFGFLCTSSGNYDGFVIGQNI